MGKSPKRNYMIGKSNSEDKGLLHDSDPEPDERELDHEEDGNVGESGREGHFRESEGGNMREYGEEDNMKEYEEGNMREYREEGNIRELGDDVREPIKHDTIDLLNLDENVKVLDSADNSPLHQIMMQQSVLHNLPSALLPNLPPPSEQQYDGELLLVGEAPPPPDMFGGAPSPMGFNQSCYMNAATPMAHPLTTEQSVYHNYVPNEPQPSFMLSQSLIVTPQSPSVTSQTPSSASLDDLKIYIEKEFSEAQTNKSPHKAQKNVLLPSSVQQDIPTADEERDIGKENPKDHHSTSSGETPVFFEDEPENNEDRNPVIDVMPEIDENSAEKEENSAIKITENISEVQQDVEIAQNPISPEDNFEEKEPQLQSADYLEEIDIFGEKHENLENEPKYSQGIDVEGLESSENTELAENLAELDENVESDENIPSFGTSEPYAAQTTDDDSEVIITALSGQQQRASSAQEILNEPLEVVELQKEPRGGNFNNRRRRNSFDQAREFGSVMDD